MEVEEIFEKTGVLQKGHFLLASGLHSPIYWEKFQVLQYPDYTEYLCSLIVDHFKNEAIEVVAGPTTGGIILAFDVARQLGTRGIFAEKTSDGKRRFRRGFDINPNERVLIVDDILTTGSSVQEVIEAVNSEHGKIIGIGVLVDRSEQGANFGYPFFSCLRSVTKTYSPDNCPLCAADVPLIKPGSS